MIVKIGEDSHRDPAHRHSGNQDRQDRQDRLKIVIQIVKIVKIGKRRFSSWRMKHQMFFVLSDEANRTSPEGRSLRVGAAISPSSLSIYVVDRCTWTTCSGNTPKPPASSSWSCGRKPERSRFQTNRSGLRPQDQGCQGLKHLSNFTSFKIVKFFRSSFLEQKHTTRFEAFQMFQVVKFSTQDVEGQELWYMRCFKRYC